MNSGIYDLTPVEEHGGMSFKREDKFAPQGYGGINGSKLRQCMYLLKKWKDEGAQGIVSGAVAASPQHAFVSSVCRMYGLGCLIVMAKKDITKSPYLLLAKKNGAHFVHSKVGYAKALNAKAEKLLSKLPGHKLLEVNITLDAKRNNYEDIRLFHEVGAYQTQNIPEHIDTVIIPCGSCNSVVSMMYGLTKYGTKNVRRIVFMGIGNNGSKNIGYIQDRLNRMCGGKLDKSLFDFTFQGDPTKKVQIDYLNLNGSGYCRYEDLMPAKVGEITFHPRYEGKCINYLQQPEYKERYWKPSTLFWVVGSDITKKT